MDSPRAARIGIALIGLSLAGCGGAPVTATNAAGVSASPALSPGALASGQACPATQPESVGPAGVDPGSFFGWGSSHGNGKLWVGGLWPRGVIAAGPEFVHADGSIGMKFGWWRAAPGQLTISGRRLDGVAPPVRADIPSGYGSTGFQASGVSFPTEGCWEVTGRVGDTTLTFVTLVRKLRT